MLLTRVLFASLLLTGGLSTGAASLTIEPAAASADSTTTQIITGPAGSGYFGERVTVLTNGNYVVVDSSFDGAAADIGAVYLYDGATNQVISTLTGTHADDQVGGGGVQEVGGGNFVVSSYAWANGGATHAGAVTWVNGVTGLTGAVSPANSLVGSTADYGVGGGSITVLTNGNYVVVTSQWDNGNIVDAGAVTFGTGAAGVSGPVNSVRSLVGTVHTDEVGYGKVQPLTNGNYVVLSPYWTLTDTGAATWGSGITGIAGPVTSTNSIIGSSAGDMVSSGGVTALEHGHYVVSSPKWSNTAPVVAGAGATTWGNGAVGTHVVVAVGNSLIGSQANDRVGDRQIVSLIGSNAYVVDSPHWNGSLGAVTRGLSALGISGVVSTANSITGSTAGDLVGQSGVTPISNGNFVISSPGWNNGGQAGAGAATVGLGSFPNHFAVSATNSIVGTFTNDSVSGGGVTPLTNGNFVVSSPNWGTTDVGAVTWSAGVSVGGTHGTLGSSNSIVGSSPNDTIGNRVVALSNGNYVVGSPSWDGVATDTGAATLGDGTNGTHEVVDGVNSLVGTTANDLVGFIVIALTNNNYVIGSAQWTNPVTGTKRVGAITWASDMTGITGPVSSANSLTGTSLDDQVGTYLQALPGGRFLSGDPSWNNVASGDALAGAITWGDGTGPIIGTVSASNSLVGASAAEALGPYPNTVMPDGRSVFVSPKWDNGSTADANAVTLAGPAGLIGTINTTNSALGTTTGTQFSPSDRLTTDHALVIGTSLNRVILLQLDVTPPSITPAPDVSAIAAPGATGTAVQFTTPAASDNRSAPTTACAPASGSTFALGATSVTCTATDGAGLTATTAFTVTVSTGADYVPLPPARLADTRPGQSTADGVFAGTGQLAAGSTLELAVAGRGGVPTDAVAVTMNVTVTEATAPGFVTVFPCGAAQPTSSNLNFVTGSTIPNAVITKIGTGGTVCVFTQQAIQLVVDVNGAFPPTTSYHAINPARVLDTRPGQTTIDGAQRASGAVGPTSVTPVVIAGRIGIPTDASAVVLNVTVTEPTATGYATVFPCGTDAPTASNLNYSPGSTIPNLVIAKVGTAGSMCIFSQAGTQLIADVLGYFPATTSLVALQPARLLDTRPGSPTIDGAFAGEGAPSAGTVAVLHVGGRGGVPTAVTTVVLNVTVTDPLVGGYVTVYPCGIDPPLASNLNFVPGQTIPNAVISKIGTNGDVCLFNSQPTQLIADVAGYFP